MRALLLLALIALPVAAHAAPTATQTAAICQHRAGCSIGKSLDAGKALTVVQASAAGCTEDWLLEKNLPPRPLLKRCKEGGTVTVGPNRLTHRQSGTSDVVWDRIVTYSLSPWHAVSERSCSYRKDGTTNGAATDIDYATLTVRSVDKDAGGPGTADCPAWPADFTVASAARLNAPGYNVAAPIIDKDAVGTKLAIGDCVPAMTTAGANGFITRGAATTADKAAEIRVLSESTSTLLVQVFDPLADRASRVEVWFPTGKELTRIGVDLAGPASAPSSKEILPSVERWQATDAAGRAVTVMRLSWANQATLFSGMAIAYSQDEGGKQARVVANTGIVNERPAYLPTIVNFTASQISPPPGACPLRDGRLMKAD